MHPGHTFAFAGAGPAALVLAARLRQAHPDASIVVVDDTPPERDARTFAFWSERPTPYDTSCFASWDVLDVHGPVGSVRVPLGTWRYRAFDMGTWRGRARDALVAAGASWVDGTVRGALEDGGGVVLQTDAGDLRARWVFDSRFDTHQTLPGLVESFRGWWVRASRAVFDPTAATLMDFRLPVSGGVRFWYVLPASPERALVMAVTLAPEPVGAELEPYLALRGLEELQVERVEAGTPPLSAGPWARRVDDRTLRIGLAGGRLKASTGYGLTRFVEDAEAVVASFERTGHPFDLPDDPARERQLDGIFLAGLARHPDEASAWFEALFRSVPAPRLFRFLDGRGTAADVLAVTRALPLRRFLGLAAAQAITDG